ncbi:hypothetical protein, partial [Polaribacter sp.]|uniref:hypothetical protein n=1 Tax=Polaribacter sp. TaxID=1920175 RepID=UPI003F6B4D24
VIRVAKTFKWLWDKEKKFKIFNYASLLALTIITYNLRQENETLKVEFAKIEVINSSLVSNMVIYNRTFEDFPLPVWGKVKRKGRFPLQYINKAYQNQFGHLFNYDRFSIFGKTNFEIFKENPSIAQLYYENDITVSITGIPLETIEYSTDSIGNLKKLNVLKWRAIVDKKDTIVYGMVKDILE